jgi:hypothetical protein
MDENPTLPQWFSQLEDAGIIFDRLELVEALQAVAPVGQAVRKRLIDGEFQSSHLSSEETDESQVLGDRKDMALQYLSEQLLLHPGNGILTCAQVFQIDQICNELGFFITTEAEQGTTLVKDTTVSNVDVDNSSDTSETDSQDGRPSEHVLSSRSQQVEPDRGIASQNDANHAQTEGRVIRAQAGVSEHDDKVPSPEPSRPTSSHTVSSRLAELAKSAMDIHVEHTDTESAIGMQPGVQSLAVHDAEMEDAIASPLEGDSPVVHKDKPTEDSQQDRQQDVRPAAATQEVLHTSSDRPDALLTVHMRSVGDLNPGESFELLKNGVHGIRVSVSDSPADRAFLRGAKMEVLKAVRKAMEQMRPTDPFEELTQGGDYDSGSGFGAATDGEREIGLQDEPLDAQSEGQEDDQPEEHGDEREDGQKVGQATERVDQGLNDPQNAAMHAGVEDASTAITNRLPDTQQARASKAITNETRSLETTIAPNSTTKRKLRRSERPDKPASGRCQRCHADPRKWYFDDDALQWICKRCYDQDGRARKSLNSKPILPSAEGEHYFAVMTAASMSDPRAPSP